MNSTSNQYHNVKSEAISSETQNEQQPSNTDKIIYPRTPLDDAPEFESNCFILGYN
jgi:hypothetical protein